MSQEEIINFGDLKVGDYINGVDGPVQVQKVYEQHIPERMFSLEFEGAEPIEASGNHLWYIETELDKHFIKDRIKNGRKILSTLSAESKVDLLQLAFFPDGEGVPETEIYDMLAICDGVNENDEYSPDITSLFINIAESIGPIMEETSSMQDINDGTIAQEKKIILYDARRFSQQILAYTDDRYSNRWPIIVGKVVTTLDLLKLYNEFEVDIPTIRKF